VVAVAVAIMAVMIVSAAGMNTVIRTVIVLTTVDESTQLPGTVMPSASLSRA
jgi:hypothetical protein